MNDGYCLWVFCLYMWLNYTYSGVLVLLRCLSSYNVLEPYLGPTKG